MAALIAFDLGEVAGMPDLQLGARTMLQGRSGPLSWIPVDDAPGPAATFAYPWSTGSNTIVFASLAAVGWSGWQSRVDVVPPGTTAWSIDPSELAPRVRDLYRAGGNWSWDQSPGEVDGSSLSLRWVVPDPGSTDPWRDWVIIAPPTSPSIDLRRSRPASGWRRWNRSS